MTNALNLPEINQEQAFDLARFLIRSNQNCFLFGQKGSGKTAILMQAIEDCGYKVNYINLSVVERNDILGFPRMFDDSEVITYKSPHYLPKLLEGMKPDRVNLFDECDKCPSEITAPLLEILQFGTINGVKINCVANLLTSNLIEERTYSNLISSALLDRGSKFILNFSFEKWIKWCQLNNIHDLIMGFLSSNQDMVCGAIESTYYATPSPRGWAMASDALTKAHKEKIVDIDTITSIISSFVGNEAGLKFQMWFSYYRKFEPKVFSYLEVGEMPSFENELTPTEKLVLSISMCYHAKLKTLKDIRSKNKFKYLENLCKYFKEYNVAPEIQNLALGNAFTFDLIVKHKLYTCLPFFEMVKVLDDKFNNIK